MSIFKIYIEVFDRVMYFKNKLTLAKVMFGREFPQKNVAEWFFRHILQDTIFL